MTEVKKTEPSKVGTFIGNALFAVLGACIAALAVAGTIILIRTMMGWCG